MANPFAQYASYSTEKDLSVVADTANIPYDPVSEANSLNQSLANPGLASHERAALEEALATRPVAQAPQAAENPFSQFAGNPFAQFSQPQQPPQRGVVNQTLRNAAGGVDAAVSMAAGLPGMVAGGISGLGTLVTGGGIDKAMQNMETMQKSNFGMGQPKPFTQEGEQVIDMLTHGMEGAKDAAGMASYRSGGGEGGRANAEFAVEALSNFLPIPGYKGVQKLGKAVEKGMAPKGKPVSAKDAFDANTKPETVKKPVDKVDSTELMNKIIADDDRLLIERLQKIDEDINTKQDNVQRQLDERQAQLEFEVKKRATLDFNAAERGRQERAPTGKQKYLATGERSVADMNTRFQELQQQLDATTAERKSQEAVRASEQQRATKEAEWAKIQETINARQAEMELRVKREQTLAQGARDLAKPDQYALERIDEHPFLVAAMEKADKARSMLAKAEMMGEPQAKVNLLEKSVKDLEARAAKTRENILNGLKEKKTPIPFNFKKQGGGVLISDGNGGFMERGGYTPKEDAPKRVPSDAEQALKLLLQEDARTHTGALGAPVWTPPKNPLKGPGKKQGGALDAAVFREGYKALNKHLSKLTDALGQDINWQKAIAAVLKAPDIQRNSDGTPMVLTHGTTREVKGELKGSQQGFHAGLGVAAPHFFTQEGTKSVYAHKAYVAEQKAYANASSTRLNGQIHPIALKKGNYEFLPFDAGDWSPKTIFTEPAFRSWFEAKAASKGYDSVAIKNFRNYVENQVGTKNTNQAFSDVLKRLDIDGFFYRNSAESPNTYKRNRTVHRYGPLFGMDEKGRSVTNTRTVGKLDELGKISQDPTSFVTWNDQNFTSIFSKEDIKPAENTDFRGKTLNDWMHDADTEAATSLSPLDLFTPEELQNLHTSGWSKKQGGGLWMGEPKKRPVNPEGTPEALEARAKARAIAERMPKGVKALDEFNVIKTPEEALALAPEAKDITKDWGQKYLGSGANFQAVMSNNPLIKYLNTVSRDVRAASNKFSQDYITNDETGLNSMWVTMKPKERIAAMEAIMEGDRRQTTVTPEVMDAMNMTKAQRQFVDTFYKANDEMYAKWNDKRMQLGMEPIEYRTGHFPGIFVGSYKALVMQDGKAVGVLATDTKAQLAVAKKHVMETMEGTSFVDKERSSLVGTTKRYYSDIFSGMTDVLDMLGKNDPRFKEVQDIVGKALAESNNKLFNFNVHQLHKKGVFGNEGNKPWLTAEENATQAYKSLVRYFEEGTMHHELQVPLQDLRKVMADPATEHLPNAKKFMENYIKKMTGDDISPIGAALNVIIDTPFKLLPTISWDKTPGIFNKDYNISVGVGPGPVLNTTGALKNFMSQYFMGWFNYTFTAAQLMQPIQTGSPFMQLATNRLGMSPHHVGTSMAKGGAQFNLVMAERIMGKSMDATDPVMRDAFKYAQERGLLTFSEMERAYQGTQSTASRLKDQLAEVNMKAGEFFTRTPMFMAFTDLLVKGGIDAKDAMPIAENMTQFAMIDYHQWERPSLYSSLGVMGQFAGGLTTFKHGYMSQQAKLGKEAIAPTKLLSEGKDGVYSPANRQFTPFLMSAMLSTMVFAGITGTPFYQELDQAYGAITNKISGKYRNIRADFLENLPEWSKTGLISNAIGLNMQGKFSAADMIPDSLPRALSPQLEALWKMIDSAIEYAQQPDQLNKKNAATAFTPSGWKGVPEKLMEPKDPQGYPLNREGLKVGETPRSPEGWTARAVTGLRPQAEAVEREKLWSQRKTEARDKERLRDISEEYRHLVLANVTDNEKYTKLQQEYMERGGNVESLIQLAIKTHMDKQLNEKQRLQGIPGNTPSSIHRYENYNR